MAWEMRRARSFRHNCFSDHQQLKKQISKTKEKKKETVTVSINEKGLMDRLTAISPRFGGQRNITVVKDGAKTHVLYLSNHDQGKNKLWKFKSKFKSKQIHSKKPDKDLPVALFLLFLHLHFSFVYIFP